MRFLCSKRHSSLIVFVIGVCVACATSAFAATINYGDLNDIAGGGSVYYNDVRESSGTDPVPLFGTPTISINLLEFPLGGFTATGNGGSADITDGQLDFTAEAVDNVGITSLTVSEFGDYTLAGAGTALTNVVANIIAFATITEVDGIAITPFTVNASMSQQYDLVSTEGIFGWDSGISIDFNAVLAGAGIDYALGVTEFEYVMDNQLLAFSESGTIAFISKKDFEIDIDTVAVPVPSTVVLLFSGMALGLFARYRHRKS